MSDDAAIVLFLSGLAVAGFIGCLIGHFKNRKGLGLFLGLLLGPIGWIIMLFVSEVPEGENGGGMSIAIVALLIVGGLFVAAIRTAETAAAERDRELSELRQRNDAAQRVLENGPTERRANKVDVKQPIATATPLRRVAPSTPSPAEVNAEILRHYGTQRTR